MRGAATDGDRRDPKTARSIDDDHPVLFHAHHEDARRRRIHGNTARALTHGDREEDVPTPSLEGREGAVALVGDKHPVRGAIHRDPVWLWPHGNPRDLPEGPRVEDGDEAVAFVWGIDTAQRRIHREMPGAAHEPDCANPLSRGAQDRDRCVSLVGDEEAARSGVEDKVLWPP